MNIKSLLNRVLSADVVSTEKTDCPLTQGGIKAKDFIASIQMNFSCGVPLIKVLINHQEYNFLLDTGSFSIIPSWLIDELSLEKNQESIFSVDSSGKETSCDLYSLPQITLGDIEFYDFTVMAQDFSDSFPLSCMAFDGVLGYNIFQGLIVKLDYDNSRVSLSDKLLKHEGFLKNKMLFDGSHGPKFNIDFGFDNRWISLDSGKNDGILIGSKIIADELRNKGFDSKKITGVFSSNINGANKDSVKETFLVKNFKIARKISITSYPIDTNNSGELLAGNEFLKNFNIILDFKKNNIYFKQLKKEKIDQEFSKDFGFSLYWNEYEKLYISAITENSSASKSKLKINDRVLSINGKDLYNYTREDYCKLFLLLSSNAKTYEHEESVEIVIKRDTLIKKLLLKK